MDFEIEEFESIPLPDQIPESSKKLNFLETPQSPAPSPSQEMDLSQHSRSRTVQTLLNQNQDLTSRLSVALKKNIALEQRLEDIEDQSKILKSHLGNSQEQNVILQDKNSHLEKQVSTIIANAKKNEDRFSELYLAYQDKIQYIQTLSYRLHRFIKYRARVRGYVRPFINRLQAEIQSLREQLLKNTELSLTQSASIKNLESTVQNLEESLRLQSQKFEKDQANLVAYHESRFNVLSKEKETLESRLSETHSLAESLKEQVATFKENETEILNKSIYFERQFGDLKSNYDNLKTSSDERIQADAQTITALKNHVSQLSEKLNETIQYAQKLTSDHSVLNDQYSSLQILYQDNLDKTEDFKKRLSSLEQMNKELSQSLLDYRKKNDHLEEKLLKSESDFKRKLESFQLRLQKPSDLTRALPSLGQKELLNKIQDLLSEIQVGKTEGAEKNSEKASPLEPSKN